MMKMLGVFAIAAGALAQTAPKIQTVNSDLVLNALSGDVVFNTAGGATASVSTMASQIDQVPTARSAAINAAVIGASSTILSSVTSMTVPMSTAVSNQAVAIGSATTRVSNLESAVGQMSTQLSTLMSNAAQYAPASASCTAAMNGKLKLVNEQLYFCVGTTWKATYHEPLGTSRGSAATDCQAIADAGDSPANGITTSWIEQHGSGGDDGSIFLAKCQFTTTGNRITGVSLGGDGSTPADAGLNCASINQRWQRPTGVYFVTMTTTMATSDDEDIVQVQCQGGRQVNGDGTDYRAPVTSCTSLVRDFNEYIYDNSTGQPIKYWQSIASSVNLALMPNPVGPAHGTASSILTPTYNVQNANDGSTDQTSSFLHGGGSGEAWPRYSLQLGGQADVSQVRVFLRTGSCASRNMIAGTGCSFSYRAGTFSGAGQGFQIRVGTEPCTTGESQCPGTLCSWVRSMTQNSIYTIACPAGTIGNYVHFQLPGQNRLLTIGEMQVFARSAQQPCSGSTAFGNGLAATTPGLNCRTIQLAASGTPPSRAYWVKPRNDMDAFQVYCDMRTWGGGWTIAEQYTGPINNGQSYPLNGRNYNDVLSRGYNHGYYNGRRDGRSLGKQKINALYSVFGIHTVIRWSYGGTYRQSRTCADALYQRLNVPSDWDVFHAMRDSRSWDNTASMHTAGAHWSYQYYNNATSGETSQNFRYYQEDRVGSGRIRCRTDGSVGSNYDRTRNLIENDAHRTNMRFHQWEEREANDGSGRTVSVSRHGVPGDPFEGCQWMFRFNSYRAQSWCRDDTSNYIMLK